MFKYTCFSIAPLIFALCALLVGCGTTACKRLCACADEEIPFFDLVFDEDDCIDECEEYYDDEDDSDCRSEIRNVARCLDREDCSPSACDEEIEDYIVECW